MRYTILLALVTACAGPAIEDTQDTQDTEDTSDTDDTDVSAWETTFYRHEDGAWVEDLEILGQRVRGLAHNGETRHVGAGTKVYQWQEGWQPVYSEAPGEIDAFTATGSGQYVAVGERLYSWKNPGVWAIWLDGTPGVATAIWASGASRYVGIGEQVHRWDGDAWIPTMDEAPAEVRCIFTDEEGLYIGAGSDLYMWEDGWRAMDLPAIPSGEIAGCAPTPEGVAAAVARLVE